jgi:hypothetical protein
MRHRIRGWISCYGHFYKTQLRPTVKRIDLYVIRWARRKFKRLRRKTKGARVASILPRPGHVRLPLNCSQLV